MRNKLKQIIKYLRKADKIAKEVAKKYNCYDDKDGRRFLVKTKEDLYKIAELIGKEVSVDDTGFSHVLYNVNYDNEIEFTFGEFLPLTDDAIEKARQNIKDMFIDLKIFDEVKDE